MFLAINSFTFFGIYFISALITYIVTTTILLWTIPINEKLVDKIVNSDTGSFIFAIVELMFSNYVTYLLITHFIL